MAAEPEFREAEHPPLCPHCGESLEQIEFTRTKLAFGFMSGFSWVILLQCGRCHKMIGTQGWD